MRKQNIFANYKSMKKINKLKKLIIWNIYFIEFYWLLIIEN